jgi:hypothetical protein
MIRIERLSLLVLRLFWRDERHIRSREKGEKNLDSGTMLWKVTAAMKSHLRANGLRVSMPFETGKIQ